MALTKFPVPGKAKSDLICSAFVKGAPRNAAGAVFFGTEGQLSAFRKAKVNGLPWYYIDNSYFDKHRGIYFRATKNALQIDPLGQTSDGARFASLKVSVQPARDQVGERVLIVPQSDDFMKSTVGVGFEWTATTKRQLEQWQIGPLHVHPWDRDKLKRNASFSELLPTARLVVTYSSAAAITALLEGVPAVSTGDSAAAYRLGGPFTRENMEMPLLASRSERLAFANVLADNQFTLEEFRNGKAWAWLNR